MLGGQKALERSPPAGECRTDRVCVCLDWCEQTGGFRPATSQFGKGCEGKNPMKSLCAAGTYKSASSLGV